MEVFCVVLVILASVTQVTPRKHSPLIGDEGGRRTQAAECQFGKNLKELGSTWFADLGPPFGVMYCIRCECVPYHRKRRVVGKVHCRNIKHECPKPSCDEPVLAPGRCCKVCPGDVDSPDIVEEQLPAAGAEEEKNLKYFAAVLVAKNVDDGEVVSAPLTTDHKATGRFTFQKRNLYFSFYSSARPRGVQFLDMRGNILEEQVVPPYSLYQNATEKVCGVWRRIPREYRRLIREEQLQVTLLWERQELAITGQLFRFRSLSTELYSSLLVGSTPLAAGTAIISVSTQAPSVHLTLAFTGLFTSEDNSEQSVTVRLHTNSANQRMVLEESVRVERPSAELTVVEVRSAVSGQELMQLSRQRLWVSVSTRAGPSITGPVKPRAHCELLHAPLAPPPPPDTPPTMPPTTGMAWLFVDKTGDLNYFVRLDGIDQPDMLGLVVERRLLELEDLTPSFHLGWANGSVSGLSPRHLEQLYGGELSVNVASTASKSLARGRLVARPVADARDAVAPSLLEPIHGALDPASTGLVWAAVDIECNLHYDVVLSGRGLEGRTLGLYLEEVPLLAPGAPITRRLLEEFNSNTVEGFVLGLTPTELTRLDTGVVNFDIKDLHTTKSLLRAHWGQVSIPAACLPHYSDNNVPPVSNVNSDVAVAERSSCFHSGAFHDEGAQWASNVEHCTLCSCAHGHVRCDTVVCPALACPPTSTSTLRPDQCCPSCTNETGASEQSQSQGCYLAGQLHAPGTTWHPYLPPAGFDTCAVCTCNATSLTVRCSRTPCPPLDCDDAVAVRRGCCKTCPNPSPTHPPGIHLSGWLGDQQVSTARTKAEVLAAGGCTYPVGRLFDNGDEWHPRVFSHGEVKSVKCHCKDGVVKCERRRHH